jgi:S-DNA-T family DNA segregation ATPase FtsK/SpoIIIE
VRDFDVVRSAGAVEVVLGDDGPTEPVHEPEPDERRTRLPTEMTVLVERLAAAGAERKVRRVWLPPLAPVLTLDSLSESSEETTAPGEDGWLRVPIGVVDRPRDQDQRPYSLSFTGRGGHLAVVGAPRSGKSMFLQTLVTSMASTHDPADVQLYGIDLGGGSLHALRRLPHVGEVYGRSEREGIFRLIRELRSLVAERARIFRTAGVPGMEGYHSARHEGWVHDDGYGEVFLLVDNWALLVQELDDLQYEIAELVTGGLHYGVHVVLTSNRWHDIRLNVRDNVGGRVELRLNDPVESEIDRHAAAALPGDVPGRALNAFGEHVQIALPRRDGEADIAGLGLALEELTNTISERWSTSRGAPPIRMLPNELTVGDVGPVSNGVPIGVEEFGLEPVVLSLTDAQPHLVVLGDGGSGKTNLLRTILRGVGDRYEPSEVLVALIDYRRQLVDDARALPHVKSIAVNAAMTTGLVLKLSEDLKNRLPSGEAALDATPWGGPHVYLLVDDYDLVSATTGNPLESLVDLLAQARDIGFHVVLARRVGGTVRTSYEAFFQRLLELGTPGLIMSGDPGEGPLLGGVKAQPLPPGRGTLVSRGRASLVQTILARDGGGPSKEDDE